MKLLINLALIFCFGLFACTNVQEKPKVITKQKENIHINSTIVDLGEENGIKSELISFNTGFKWHSRLPILTGEDVILKSVSVNGRSLAFEQNQDTALTNSGQFDFFGAYEIVVEYTSDSDAKPTLP